MRLSRPLAVLCIPALAAPLAASDPIGIYAAVDKVLVEPSEGPAERVQIWGAFALAAKESRNAYAEPQRGYLYCGLEQGKEEECRKQWEDLRRLARSGQAAAMASRHAKLPRVRRASEKPEKPDAYVTGWGLHRFQRRLDYEPVRRVLAVPLPKSPADGGSVPPGKVTLVCGKLPGVKEGARYLFEIDGRNQKEKSPAIEPGKEDSSWTPALELEVGIEYTWRVRLKEGDWEGPVVNATFKVEKPEKPVAKKP